MSINVLPTGNKQFPIAANFNGYGEQKFTLLAARELAKKLTELADKLEKGADK